MRCTRRLRDQEKDPYDIAMEYADKYSKAMKTDKRKPMLYQCIAIRLV